MEAIERSTVYERDMGREAMTVECALEHTLPDYMPEIRKILRVDARPIEGGRYIEDGRAEFSGIVSFTVVYLGGEGTPSAVSLNGDYTVTVPLASTPSCAYLATELEGVSCRPLGPRRLSLRAQLRARPHLVCELPVPAPEEESSLRLLRACEGRHTAYGESGEIGISDTVAVPGIAPEALHPLFCDGSFDIEECRVSADACTLRGSVHARVVGVGEDGRPMSFQSRIPVEREIDLEGARTGDTPLAEGQLTSLSVRATGDGEGGTLLELDGTAECRLRLYRNERIAPTVRMYSPTYRTEATRGQLLTEALVGATAGHYTASGGTAAPGDERAVLVLDTSPSVSIRKITEEGGRPIVLGDVRVRMLLAGATPEEGPTPCFSTEYTHPFRIEAPISLPVGREVRYECTVTPILSRGRIEEGGYADDTELALSLAVFAPSTVTAVTEVTAYPDEPYPAREGTVTVVYPKDGDTLFSVAERYHTTPAALALTNRLGEVTNEEAAEPTSLDGIGFLLLE